MIRAFVRPYLLLLKLVIFQPENQINSMRSMPFQPWALFERRDTPVKHEMKQIFISIHLLKIFRSIYMHIFRRIKILTLLGAGTKEAGNKRRSIPAVFIFSI